MAYYEGEISGIGTNCGNGNNGFGNGFEGWWGIILLALIFGWGGNGYGFGGNRVGQGGGFSGIADNYALATDFATLERKLDGVNNGLCDGFYAQNTNMLNGFASVQQTLCQGFSGINTAITTNGYETRDAISNLGYRLQDCCCTIGRSIDGVNYNMATHFGALNNTLCNVTRDIIDNQNANYRAIHDEIVANRIEDKNALIQAQQNQITALQLKASQEAQNAYLINELKPCPKPAYITCNPYQSAYGYGLTPNTGCGCSGCGSQF